LNKASENNSNDTESLLTRTKRDTTITTVTKTETSIEDDLCIPNPCKNGGSCQQLGDFFACICPTPFCGWYCEKTEGDQSDECERWAKLGYCINDFKEFMLSNCPRACRDWHLFKQRTTDEALVEEISGSGEGQDEADLQVADDSDDEL